MQDITDDEPDEWQEDRQRVGTSSFPGQYQPDEDGDEDDEEDGVAQFEEDEGEVFESEDEETNLGKHKLYWLFITELASIPFGTLVKAQRKLNKQQAQARFRRKPSGNDDDESDLEGNSEEDGTEQGGRPKVSLLKDRKGKGKAKVNANQRSSKHAPMELSSKKPVTRNRQVIEVQANKARDPRFDSLSGNIKSDLFSRSYGFLADQQTAELEALRKTVALARKKGGSEEEKERMEDALQRMESREISRKNKARDQEALRAWKKEELEKRQQGKQAFHLKSAERKALLLKAKFDVLAQDKKQLRKTIEKKRKKTAQKDKKLLPQRR
ncbi:BZ3500_MvSof-1268-A1-R1_Chr2-2g04873 [Microbotryum saponariae]|uniref:rRNA biogenesis protein RRP36 n=1 Tax=Microbotryum saponariae TaxID=289078 RepID=A0A2X0K5X9_9BASI|nr:BZ3500_MvSof-1268-A1-R1_Chr2-2g04873 [Microbotryum saponariae]SDA00374.1 BZ3501_MvSof-1269-A2-R1_Chr2-2g04547 [Microbotryum saponariae]